MKKLYTTMALIMVFFLSIVLLPAAKAETAQGEITEVRLVYRSEDGYAQFIGIKVDATEALDLAMSFQTTKGSMRFMRAHVSATFINEYLAPGGGNYRKDTVLPLMATGYAASITADEVRAIAKGRHGEVSYHLDLEQPDVYGDLISATATVNGKMYVVQNINLLAPNETHSIPLIGTTIIPPPSSSAAPSPKVSPDTPSSPSHSPSFISSPPNGNISANPNTPVVKAKKIRLSRKRVTLRVLKKLKLKAMVTPKSTSKAWKKVVWKSSNKRIARVSKTGWVKAIKPGKARIIAKLRNGKRAVLRLTVKRR